jgi:hypothetical protein
MTEEQESRLVSAFEGIAIALHALSEQARRAGLVYWPAQREQREAILTHVETDDEREIKMQGARRRSIAEVIDPNAVEEEEDDYAVGARSRQWLKDHPPTKPETKPTPSGDELA